MEVSSFRVWHKVSEKLNFLSSLFPSTGARVEPGTSPSAPVAMGRHQLLPSQVTNPVR
jgi:hypothetical protein